MDLGVGGWGLEMFEGFEEFEGFKGSIACGAQRFEV